MSSIFNKKDNSTIGPKTMNHLGTGTVIEGDLASDADIRIDGQVKGNVQSKGKVVLGTTGTIDGDIRSENAFVEGRVNGRVEVTELLILAKTAFVNGDIVIKKLVVEEGAKFNGSCKMGIQVNRQSESEEKLKSNVHPIGKAV